MAHPQQRSFCESVKAKFPAAFVNVRALDVGSADLNGSNRDLFTGGHYTGIDVAPGKNVDIIVPCHLHKAADGTYDTIISSECFEHDLHQFASLVAIRRMLRSGGLFLFTCATTGRAEHGTTQSKPWDAPGLPWPTFYRNLTEDDVRWVYEDMKGWSQYEFSTNMETCDLYFWGLRQ